MSARSFLDTNVLVYTDDADAPAKRAVALDLIEQSLRDRVGVISTQVLQEYFVAATRKLGVNAVTARRKIELLSRLDLVPIGLAEILAAVDLHRLHEISFWDALIVRAALESGCQVLFSEDLQHGRRFDALEVVDPFR
ncbi:MAG: PIN domain-containing protein [Acidobacteriota bacterium]|nr:MAG: PIN domain-containing protein [Acidobacteriota bacterium]